MLNIRVGQLIASMVAVFLCATHAVSLASPPVVDDIWIIELVDKPFAQITHAAARPHQALRSHEGRLALDRITASQARAMTSINNELRRPVQVLDRYQLATVGLVLNVTDDEAQRIAGLPGIASVTKDQVFAAPTGDPTVTGNRDTLSRINATGDPVVDLIGAAAVWDGSATGDEGHQGEGVIVGVIGTGINGDHPSFAAVGDDGYEHVNPYGEGVYAGECFATPELTCNNKLIGRWYFAQGDATSEDANGYGTFVTGFAAGNRLLDASTIGDFGANIVTGVAPHANVISYGVCNPSCPGTAVIAAFEQAIADGVDVLVTVVGTPNQSPWDNIFGQLALSVRSAGASLTYAVNSSGPAPGSLNLSLAAPWVATFSTTTHGRDPAAKELAALSGGDLPLPPLIRGRSVTQGLTAPIVFAGDYPNPNAAGSDPAQCLQPYPMGTFDGQIVVCERGEIARLQKSINVAEGGAGGIVLANVADGSTFLGSDFYVVPGININADDAAQLLAWLASGSNHVATIRFDDTAPDPARADLVAAFNARGPNRGLNYLAPNVAAPALDVVGPWIEPDTFLLAGARGSAPGAGALALLKSVHPQWTPAQALSALMTTAKAPLREIDGVTPTGPFDHGGGRIDVAAAAAAGLLLDATTDEFLAADPAIGGDPAALNLAGLVQLECIDRCAWTRELTAARDGTWGASGTISSAKLDVRVAPAQFTLAAGETQTLSIEVNRKGELPDAQYTGQVVLTPQEATVSTTRLPLVVGLTADDDNDGVANTSDNCQGFANADQRDTDADGFGNACDADFNGDCVVNARDLGVLRQQFFQTGDLDTDLDGDQSVGASDLARLRTLFFGAPGPSGLVTCDF